MADVVAADKAETLQLLLEQLAESAEPPGLWPPADWARADRDTPGETLAAAVWVASGAMVARWMAASSAHADHVAMRSTIEAMWRARITRSRALKAHCHVPLLFFLPEAAAVLQVVRTPAARVLCHVAYAPSVSAAAADTLALHAQRLLAAAVLPALRAFAHTAEAAVLHEAEDEEAPAAPGCFLITDWARPATTEVRVHIAHALAVDCQHDAIVDAPHYDAARIDATVALVAAVTDYALFAVAEAAKGAAPPYNQVEGCVVAGEMALLLLLPPATRHVNHLVHPDQLTGDRARDVLSLLAQWTVAAPPPQHHRVFFPLNGDGHWSLLVYDSAARVFWHVDSLLAGDGAGSYREAPGQLHAGRAAAVARAFAPRCPVQTVPLAHAADRQQAAECGLYTLVLAGVLARAPSLAPAAVAEVRVQLTRAAVLAHVDGPMRRRWTAAARDETLAEALAAVRAAVRRGR